MHYLENACRAQMTRWRRREARHSAHEVCEKRRSSSKRSNRDASEKDWPALMRMLDRSDSSTRTEVRIAVVGAGPALDRAGSREH